MKKITVITTHNHKTPQAVKMVVPDDYTYNDALQAYFDEHFNEWANKPFKCRPYSKLGDSPAEFFRAVKKLSNTRVVELGSRRELAERLGISFARCVACLAKLRSKGYIETKRFSNRSKKSYYLKY